MKSFGLHLPLPVATGLVCPVDNLIFAILTGKPPWDEQAAMALVPRPSDGETNLDLSRDEFFSMKVEAFKF
jgi:hypothetical protein